MNRIILYIVVFLFAFSGNSQNKKKQLWKSEKEKLEYRKKAKYNGPEDWSGAYPSDIEDEDYVSTNSGGSSHSGSSGSNSSRNLRYNPQQIQRDRKRLDGFDRGGGSGGVEFDPTVERPDPIELPDIDPIDIDPIDVDLPDIDMPSIPMSFWKGVLFVLIFVAVFVVVYLIIKNKKPSDKKVIVDIEDDWNPEVISKTELELRLDAAIEKEDYRECIRIYFTFILKELIRKSWIQWKKQKTNHHYVIEMQRRSNAMSFNECVRIYDIVWYGDYNIDNDIYELLKPTLEEYYQSLEPINE